MPKGCLKIQYIEDKKRRFSAFSKRKTGLMTKAKELHVLTGSNFMIICETAAGSTYTFYSDPAMERLTEIVREHFPKPRGGASSPSTASTTSLDSKFSIAPAPPESNTNQPDLGPMEFRKFRFGDGSTDSSYTAEEKCWTVSGSGLRRRDFMKESNVVSNQEKGKLSYILNPPG